MASRSDLGLCAAGDSQACYRAIRDEGNRIRNEAKEKERRSGVSSGDPYSSSGGRDRDVMFDKDGRRHHPNCSAVRQFIRSKNDDSSVYCSGICLGNKESSRW